MVVEGWQSIENCPDDGRMIWVYWPYRGVLMREADGGWWRYMKNQDASDRVCPTHWQACPIPLPPVDI